jgi:hypothetical protein
MKLAKALLFATMLVGMSAHAAKGTNANCANSPKGLSVASADGSQHVAAVFGSTANPAKKTVPQTTPKTGR